LAGERPSSEAVCDGEGGRREVVTMFRLSVPEEI
jgi:hypothetical protein